MTLSRSVFALVLLCLVASSAIIGSVTYLQSARLTESNLEYTVRFRTDSAASSLARTLEREWRDLAHFSDQLPALDQSSLNALLTGANGDGGRVSWMGYADLNGEVVAASNGMLVGASVDQRPWFRGGLNGGFAGDVHEAVLLAQLLNPDGEDPLRFIDLALPVRDAEANPAGVLGMHINAEWLTEYLAEMSDIYGLDFYLLNPNGTVSAATTGDFPTSADLQIIRAAQAGVPSSALETWPDGREYFASIVPQVTYGDLPNFGWRMIGRLDVNTLDFRAGLIRSGVAYALLASVALILLATLIYARIVLAPIGRLADSAHRVADGSQEYPAESRSSREAGLLSAALARLQQDRVRNDD